MVKLFRLKLSKCYRKLTDEYKQHNAPFCEGEKCSRYPKCLHERIESLVALSNYAGANQLFDRSKLMEFTKRLVDQEDEPYQKKEG